MGSTVDRFLVSEAEAHDFPAITDAHLLLTAGDSSSGFQIEGKGYPVYVEVFHQLQVLCFPTT
jgi:hypothetical protein